MEARSYTFNYHTDEPIIKQLRIYMAHINSDHLLRTYFIFHYFPEIHKNS